MNAVLIMAMRVAASVDGKELNNSPRIAQKIPSAAICGRVRNPPASMMGNRYRKFSEKFGLVAQSTTAITAISAPAAVSARARFGGEYRNVTSGISPKLLDLHLLSAIRGTALPITPSNHAEGASTCASTFQSYSVFSLQLASAPI